MIKFPLICRVLSHVFTIHSMGFANLVRDANLITHWVLWATVLQHHRLVTCLSLHILSVSLLLLWPHLHHLLVCGQSTFWARTLQQISQPHLELHLDLLDRCQKFMLHTCFSVLQLLQPVPLSPSMVESSDPIPGMKWVFRKLLKMFFLV